MDAAEIKDEHAVDEDPQIVVAGESEYLVGTGRRVAERNLALELQREVIVVGTPLVAVELTVDREEGVVAIGERYGRILGEGQRNGRAEVVTGRVDVPLGKVRGGRGPSDDVCTRSRQAVR